MKLLGPDDKKSVPAPVMPKSSKTKTATKKKSGLESRSRHATSSRSQDQLDVGDVGNKRKNPKTAATSPPSGSLTSAKSEEVLSSGKTADVAVDVDVVGADNKVDRAAGRRGSEPQFPPEWANVVDEIRHKLLASVPTSAAPGAGADGRGRRERRRREAAGGGDDGSDLTSPSDPGSPANDEANLSSDATAPVDDVVVVENANNLRQEAFSKNYDTNFVGRINGGFQPDCVDLGKGNNLSSFGVGQASAAGDSSKGFLTPNRHLIRPHSPSSSDGNSRTGTPIPRPRLITAAASQEALGIRVTAAEEELGSSGIRVSKYTNNPKEWVGLGDGPYYDPELKGRRGGKRATFLNAYQDAHEMAVVKNCCGCCDIRKGVFIVAIINVLLVGALCAYFAYVLHNFYRQDVYNDVRDSYMSVKSGLVDSLNSWVEGFMGTDPTAVQGSLRNGVIVLIAICAAYVALAVILGYGAFAYNPWLHLPWIIAEFLLGLAVLIVMGYYFYYRIGLSQVADEGQFIVQIALFCIVAGLVAYGWMAAVSHFQMLVAMNDKMTPVEPMDDADQGQFDPYDDMRQRKIAAISGGGGGFGEADDVSCPVDPITLRPSSHLPSAGGDYGAHMPFAEHPNHRAMASPAD